MAPCQRGLKIERIATSSQAMMIVLELDTNTLFRNLTDRPRLARRLLVVGNVQVRRDVVSVVESAPHLGEDGMAHRGAYGVLDEDVVEDDPVAASPESPATPSVARGAMSSRMLGKHVGEVLNYLALLSWNRCVMHLVGGPTRTTIDVLMTRQFHGLMLVWTWAYTLGVSSACVAVVRWSAEKRASLEEKETERSRTTRDEASDQSSDVTQTRRKKMSVVGALLRSPLSPPIFTLRFKSFAHRRLQGACVFTCMWSLAVATLGTLPSNTVSDDVFSTLLLSFFFALVARTGAKGKGPLGPVLRVTTEFDLFTRDEGVAAEDVEGLFSENETSRVTRDAVRVTCEWIVAVAWVGAARRFLNVAFGIRETENGLKAQLVGWLVALVAVGARAAFVAARAAGRDEPWSHEFARDAEEAAEVFGAFGGFGSSASQSDVTLRDGGAPIETSPNETPLLSGRPQGSDASELVRVPEEGDAGRGVRAKILDSVSVARDASSVLAGAFAFTAGVALNAAAQTTWFSVAGPDAGPAGLRLGAAASAVAYATALSAVTIAAATYAERARDASECAVECASNGDDAKRRRRVIVARELAADEERVGAFIAGFAWNAAFSALVGNDGVSGWPWIAAAGWTAAAAGYAAVEESVREVKAALDGVQGGGL